MYMCEYNAIGINIIQVYFVQNNILPELAIKNINKVQLDKNLVMRSLKQTKSEFNEKLLRLLLLLLTKLVRQEALTNKEGYYGKKLDFVLRTDNKGFVSSLKINNLDFITNIENTCKESNLKYTPFPSSTSFYLYSPSSEEADNKKYIIVVKHLDDNKSIKDVYNQDGLVVLGNVMFSFKPLENVAKTIYNPVKPKEIVASNLHKAKKNPLAKMELRGYSIPSTMDISK